MPSCGLQSAPSTRPSDRCKPCNRPRRPGTRSLCPTTGDPCPEGRRPVRQARCRLTKALLASDTPRLRSGAGVRPDGIRFVTRSGSVQEKLSYSSTGWNHWKRLSREWGSSAGQSMTGRMFQRLGTEDSVLHGRTAWRSGRSVSMPRISPSCRINTMPTVATIFRGRNGV